MESLGGSMPGGVAALHSDVLQATPDSPEAKVRLLEELKNRARSAVQTKNYKVAELLYTKGLSVVAVDSEKAVLHANLSLVQRNMTEYKHAERNAQTAIDLDGTYVKGYWRLGQALSSLHRTEDALNAFGKALELDPNNKALNKECTKLKKQLEAEESLLEQEVATEDMTLEVEEPKHTKPITTTTTTKNSSSKTSSTATATSTNTSTSTATKDQKEEKIFTKSDHVKGYKVVNGKKTSFFHNELTAEAKALIGDIAPKRLEDNQQQATDNSAAPAKGASAWNKAGTWEEKDVSTWGKNTLKQGLLSTTYTLPEGSPDAGAIASISKLKDDLEGNVSFATVRGKKRYLYEFSVGLEWNLELTNGHTCRGKMSFPDIDGTCELGEGYDMMEFSVDDIGDTPPDDARHLVERFVKNGGLRDALHQCVDNWVILFRATY